MFQAPQQDTGPGYHSVGGAGKASQVTETIADGLRGIEKHLRELDARLGGVVDRSGVVERSADKPHKEVEIRKAPSTMAEVMAEISRMVSKLHETASNIERIV